jgi:hypothetical protein
MRSRQSSMRHHMPVCDSPYPAVSGNALALLARFSHWSIDSVGVPRLGWNMGDLLAVKIIEEKACYREVMRYDSPMSDRETPIWASVNRDSGAIAMQR